MDAREEISRWLALLVQLSSEAESDQIDGDIKMLTGVTLQLSSELAKRNTYLAKQCRPNKPAILPFRSAISRYPAELNQANLSVSATLV